MFDIWEGIFCDFDSPHIYKVYKKFLFFRYMEYNWKIIGKYDITINVCNDVENKICIVSFPINYFKAIQGQ